MGLVAVFGKGQWQKTYLDITTRQQSGNLAGQQIGIGACQVNIYVGAEEKAVNCPLVFAYHLYLIEEYIVLFVGQQLLADVGI